jgi:hypothetical protein
MSPLALVTETEMLPSASGGRAEMQVEEGAVVIPATRSGVVLLEDVE